MKEIKLTKGFVAIVDDEDFKELSKHKWYYHNMGYAVRKIRIGRKAASLLLHVAIMGKIDGLEIDHVNGDKLDNRRENLRHVTHQQNIQNQRPIRGGMSRYKGVHWHKANKNWISSIRTDGKVYHLGCYDSEQEAALAYNKSAIKLFGECAMLNLVSTSEMFGG